MHWVQATSWVTSLIACMPVVTTVAASWTIAFLFPLVLPSSGRVYVGHIHRAQVHAPPPPPGEAVPRGEEWLRGGS
ncbi:hypothetical protein LXA43DRAFT_93713 [Ganoderma leucocontextum]|nr:hypothetical protein LXA43DRAFT_93713 [Ganoderma leucocontextum]